MAVSALPIARERALAPNCKNAPGKPPSSLAYPKSMSAACALNTPENNIEMMK
jgi:hypothetical protein